MFVASQWKISSLRWFTHFLYIQLSSQISAWLSQWRLSVLLICSYKTGLLTTTLSSWRQQEVIPYKCGLFFYSILSSKHTVTWLKEEVKMQQLWGSETPKAALCKYWVPYLRGAFVQTLVFRFWNKFSPIKGKWWFRSYTHKSKQVLKALIARNIVNTDKNSYLEGVYCYQSSKILIFVLSPNQEALQDVETGSFISTCTSFSST